MQAADLLGTGTACLVWSSPLPGDARRPMRYIDLMGGQKPHLLVKTVNNLGAETHVHYAPSTKFYLLDKRAGIRGSHGCRFPSTSSNSVETIDHISRSRFVTRYTYRHGYFDGVEREFRGFGLVDQLDTEEFGALAGADALAGQQYRCCVARASGADAHLVPHWRVSRAGSRLGSSSRGSGRTPASITVSLVGVTITPRRCCWRTRFFLPD